MHIAITIRTYADNGWYGSRVRYCYLGPEGTGFKNKTEASKFKGIFKKFVKNYIKNQFNKPEINGDIEIGKLSDFETYVYCGAGPSYYCPQIIINHSELLLYINNIEK